MKGFSCIASHQFKRQFRNMLLWSLILGFISLLVGWAYSPFKEAGYFELMEGLPDYIIDAFLGDVEAHLADTPEGFLSLEYFSWMGLMLAFYPIISASGVIAGEIEKGTLEPLLSKPVSRAGFYWGNLLVFSVYVFFFILLNFIFLGLGLKSIGEGLKWTHWLGTFVLMVCSTLSFLSLTFFISALFNTAQKVLTVVIAFGVFQYMFFAVVNAVGREHWSRWTVFYNARVVDFLFEDLFPWTGMIYIFLLFAAFAVLGYLIFEKKDIAA